MTEAQKSLLEHLAASLFGKPTEREVTQEVITEARQQAVVTLLPCESYKGYWNVVRHNVSVTMAHQRLHDVMTENGVPYATIKGVASAAYYPAPDLRQMGDVDFIVRKEDVDRVCALLESKGFVSHHEKREHHVEYSDGSVSWELHWQVPGLPDEHEGVRYFDDLIDQAEFVDCCMAASAFHHGLILLTHSAGHMLSCGIGLRHLCDWAVFYAAFDEERFCEMFEKPLREIGLWKYAQIMTAACMKYLHSPERKWPGEHDEQLLEAVIEDIVTSGNFGVKDRDRVNQAKLITDTGTRAVSDRGFFGSFLTSLARRARQVFPACERHGWLLPVGMLYAGVGALVHIAQKRRPAVHMGKTFTGARKRKEIYQHFELFQPEE